jgi:DNA polymerase-1
MACRRPNVQQVPRDARYRTCIVAAPGSVLVKVDYSQIELRIAARIAEDAAMQAAYREGADLHTLTAQRVLGTAEVTKHDRQLAKALNFGLLYGMGAEGFRRHARTHYGLALTPEEATRYRAAFFAAYPGLAAWHRRVKQAGARETRTLAGRRRLLGPATPDTERLNTPVQGTGADGLKLALALLWERRTECLSARPVIACHDEIVVECAAGDAEAAAAWVRQAMVDAMRPFLDPIPVEVEVTLAPTWAG